MKKRIVITVIMSILLLSTSVKAYVPPGVTGHTIYAGYVPQQCSNWCWAASAQNAAKVEYPSSTRTQSDIVNYVKGNTANKTATHAQTKRAANYACYNTKSFTVIHNSFYYSVLKDLIYNGHPIIAFLSAGLLQAGHYVLFMGWGITESNVCLVYFYDPGNGGSYEYENYYGLCSGSYYNMPYNCSIYYGG